jgi:aspartate aminotransferase
MSVSKKIQNFMESSSWIRKMFEEGIKLKKEFGEENVFDLSLGNPVMEPPQELIDKLKASIEDKKTGTHRYMPNSGFPETRRAIADSLKTECGIQFNENHVVMVCGAAGGLNITLKTLLNPDDEVIIFAPFFVEYVFYADNHGGKTVTVPTLENFTPDLEAFKKAINNKTKAVIVNSPNNPTGIVYPRQTFEEIGNILREKSQKIGHPIYLISDDPYKKIIFDGVEAPNVCEFYENSIYITSHSKDLAVPGERIGFVAMHPECDQASQVMEGLVFCNRVLGFVNAPALMQRTIMDLQTVKIDIEQYKRKRDFLFKELTDIGYKIVKPQGAFYMFPESPLKDDTEFCKLLASKKVLTVPGKGFGQSGYFRLSYCFPDSVLEGSIMGFETAFKESSIH